METGSKGENTALSLTHLHSLGLCYVIWEEEMIAFVHSPSFQIPSLHGVPKSGLHWHIWLNDEQIKSEKSFSVLKILSL